MSVLAHEDLGGDASGRRAFAPGSFEYVGESRTHQRNAVAQVDRRAVEADGDQSSFARRALSRALECRRAMERSWIRSSG